MKGMQTWKQWRFYVRHSLRDLLRNGSRTAFALFCIATGVAAVVALRSLALMIADELTTNLAEINRGDMRIVASSRMESQYISRNSQNELVFSPEGVSALESWAAAENVDIQFASNINFAQVLPVGANARPFTTMVILIEPDTWPYYGTIYSSQPASLPLKALFSEDSPRQVVMSERVARDNRLQVGDQVQINGQGQAFTISALVGDESEGSMLLQNGPAGLLGFMYYPLDEAETLGLSALPGTAHIRLPLGRSVEALDASLEARFGDNISRQTTTELAEQNADAAGLINDLILVMGLSSILIGGIGIINTMQVIVGRRTLEIAVLKTLGLKAWRITTLFLVEAALMGLLGSLIGLILGIILSYLVRGVGESVLQTSLSWRPYPEAWFSGVALGMVVTVAFGFLPTLIAGQVRPAAVLRPNDIQLPRAGLLRSLAATLLMILLFGLTLNVIVQGRLELPPTLMIGLGATIIGLFAGTILANQGVLGDFTENPTLLRYSPHFLAGLAATLLLVGLFALRVLGIAAPGWTFIYAVSALLGLFSYGGLRLIMQHKPDSAWVLARWARRLMLWVGGLLAGGLVSGGTFALGNALLAVLYPEGSSSQTLLALAGFALLLGLLVLFIFRQQAARLSAVLGLALLGGAVSGTFGFSIGDLLQRLLGGSPFWRSFSAFSTGIIVIEIAVLVLGLSYVLMWGIVWLAGKLPNMGNVDLKLSLRNISNRRARTASTMLGLGAGIAALSLITLTTSAVTTLLESQLETNAGGNVFVLASNPAAHEAVTKRLESRLEGVKSFSQFTGYRARIVAVNGEAPELERFQAGDAADGNRSEFGQIEGQRGIGYAFNTIDPRQHALDYDMEAGRPLGAEDVGALVMVIREPFPGSMVDQLNLEVGSTITWLMRSSTTSDGESLELTYTIVGIIDRDSEQSGLLDDMQAPMGSVPASISADSMVTIADIEDAHMDAAMVEFAQIANVLAIELDFIVQLIQRLLDQLIAIPTLVAVLALLAGIAIIANTVALDTQERRRQIGILKAVGLKGYRILAQMMFENALIGFLAGLVGVSVGAAATLLIGVLGEAEQISDTLQPGPALALIVLAVLISLVATLLSAWSAARENPMNVLRYE